MKFIIALVLLLPIAATAQTLTNYNLAMKRFQQFYNSGHADSIDAMFGHHWDNMKTTKPIWTNKEGADLFTKYGTLKSFQFIGIDTLDPQHVYVFQTFFSKAGKKMTSLTLDDDYALGTFRFSTIPDGTPVLPNKSKKNK